MRLLRSLWSGLRGEVSTAELEARRAAGAAAYSLAEEAEGATGPFAVCAWNAFALQTIADKLLEADAAADPATEGYVPRSTLRYTDACLDEVRTWLRLARVVQSDPEARIAAALPARLPRWRYDEPTRQSELHGLDDAYEALQARVETALGDDGPHELRRVAAEMSACADYARGMWRRDSGPVERGEVRAHLLEALDQAFLLGQLVALPTLAEVSRVERDRAEGLPLGGHASWLQIGPGWPVLDKDAVRVGLVVRIRGDRQTGRFDGLDVDAGAASPEVHVPAAAIAAVRAGEVVLSVARGELS